MADKTAAQAVTYGCGDAACVRAENVVLNADGSEFDCVCAETGEREHIVLPLLGEHNIYNALAAIGVAVTFNVPLAQVKVALKDVKLTGKRQEFVQIGAVTVINDAYNASPASMASALKTLHAVKSAKGGRAVAVLADMLELGALSQSAHAEVGEMAVAEGVDVLITYGEEAVNIGKAAQNGGVKTFICKDRAEAAKILSGVVRNNDIILLKGSHSMQVDGLIDLVLKK